MLNRSQYENWTKRNRYCFRKMPLKTMCYVNLNWIFLMEPSRMSHATELSLFLWCYARWRTWKCGYTWLKAATMHAPVLAFMLCCSGIQNYYPEISHSGRYTKFRECTFLHSISGSPFFFLYVSCFLQAPSITWSTALIEKIYACGYL